jgi:hypothetical protein
MAKEGGDYFEILLPNKDPFQIKHHMQRTHLRVLCIYEKKKFETFENEFFPLILFGSFMEKSRKFIIFNPIESHKGATMAAVGQMA